MQAQIQALLVAGAGAETAERATMGLTWDFTWRWPSWLSSMEKQRK